MDRAVILADLYSAVTKAECDQALDAAEAWLAAHPRDDEVSGACEQAGLMQSAWDLSLADWPQADRDALLRELGRT